MADAGFTGTRRGMTAEQKSTLGELLRICRPDYFHHGDCVGADAEGAEIADALRIHVIRHPPADDKLRAFSEIGVAAREPKPYHARNRGIVDEAAWLIAVPAESVRVDTGGTWYTVGYAEQCGKPVMIVWPNGALELLTGKPLARKGNGNG